MSLDMEGKQAEALAWMDKARAKVGETPEVLCRYSVVYSSFDDQPKADEFLGKCLRAAPNHPRANYLLGIDLKEKGDLEGAIEAYMTAIKNYPATDRYHLNEGWNNLGTAYYEQGRLILAKAAWEKAVAYLPEDPMAMQNLNDFIYGNPDLAQETKGSQSTH